MGQCLTPYRLKTGEDVPCGRCPECLRRRVSGWSFRLQEQNKWAKTAHFVTLTYDTEVVPLTKSGFMTLKKRDVQLFFKRLRFIHDKTAQQQRDLFIRKNPRFDKKEARIRFRPLAIKYYICGEYGSKTNRPHYHAIIFNSTMEAISQAWQLEGKPLGHTHIDEVNGATINYTLKYMSKPHRVPMFPGDQRVPEFSLMSKGLGLSYVNDQTKAFHEVALTKDGKLDLSKSRMYLVMPGGFKVAMPRYYKQKLFSDDFNRTVIAYISGEKARKKAEEKVGDTTYIRDRQAAVDAALRAFKKAPSDRKTI